MCQELLVVTGRRGSFWGGCFCSICLFQASQKSGKQICSRHARQIKSLPWRCLWDDETRALPLLSVERSHHSPGVGLKGLMASRCRTTLQIPTCPQWGGIFQQRTGTFAQRMSTGHPSSISLSSLCGL